MYKTNPYNGKKYKKKKVYSSIKDPYIVSDKLILENRTSGTDIFMELFGISNNPWMIFFRDILKGSKSSPWSATNKLENIMYLTKDDTLQKKIYIELMRIKDYDPLVDPIPIELLSENTKKYIEKKQKQISKNIMLNEVYKNEIKIEENTFYFTASKDINFYKINFKSGYDIVIYLDGGTIKVCSSLHSEKPNGIYKIYLSEISKKLKDLYSTTISPNKTTIEINATEEEENITNILEDIITLLYTDLVIKKIKERD
jgi:hypothetical protein